MAGVYIKGMEMPESCRECPLIKPIHHTSYCQILGKNCGDIKKRNKLCPLVEVPDHGDLIDRDVLMKYKASAYDINDHELYAVGTGTILRMPAVIPADNGEKEEI